MLQEGEHQVARAGAAALVDHRVERLEPLPRLVAVDVQYWRRSTSILRYLQWAGTNAATLAVM